MNTRVIAVALVLAIATAAPLAGAPAAVPQPLEPWAPWVLDRHPDLACPRLDDDAVCVWPGRLRLDLGDAGGSFRLEVVADAEAVVELPGDAVHWPAEVTVNGAAAVLRGDGGRPAVKVEAGRHRLAGQFRWRRRPESLAVPAAVATVELRLDGREVPRPRREADGRLWLGESRESAQEADRLELAVHRLLADGVPREQVYPLLATRAGADRAFAKLGQLKPYIQWWEAGAQPAQWLAAGDVVMTSTYTGRIADAHRAGRNLALVWPGSLYGMDYWAVVKGSKRGAEARRFIAFANAPDAQVRYVENIPYGPTNRQAAQRLPAQLASWVPTAPANLEQGLAMDDEFWVEHGEELEERFNAWASQ